jgi:hypothetical protein
VSAPAPAPGAARAGELLVEVAAATNGTDAKSLRRGFALGDRVTGASSAPCGRFRQLPAASTGPRSPGPGRG